MKNSSLIALLSITAPLYSMDAKRGDTVTWHTREYTVTKRYKDTNVIKITMERPLYHICGLTFSKEKITRTFNANDARETNSPFGEHTTTALGAFAQGGAIGTSIAVLLAIAKYYVT